MRILVSVVIALHAATAAAQGVPTTVSFTGRLVDSSGNPVDGQRSVTVKLFDAATAGTEVWSEAHPGARFEAGLVYLTLGETDALDEGVLDGGPVWLEIAVDNVVMSPRLAIASVPYAVRAGVASTADTLGTLAPSDVVTSVTATGGLVGGGAGGDVSVSLATCSASQIFVYGASGWACGNLPAGDITGITTAMGSGLSGGATSGDASLSVTFTTSGGDNGTATTVARGDHLHDGRYFTESELQTAGTINASGNPVDWTKLKGVPSGLADGIDDVGSGTATDVACTGACISGPEIADAAIVGSHVSSSTSLTVASVTASGDVVADRVLEGGLGRSRYLPASSCNALRVARPTLPSGVYWVQTASAPSPFQVYCDMTTDGGGWTLVWSNLRGGRGKPMTEIQWHTAINTIPRVGGQLSSDLESFTVYTGLKYWPELAPSSLLRYSWANDYGSAIDQSFRCTFGFTLPNYNIGLIGCTHLVGSVQPGLYSYHNTAAFTTYDRDNDSNPTNCAGTYSSSPWWYVNCWSGSINGGGEFSSGYQNGAHWTNSAGGWGDDSGNGAGNGWIFVK